MGERKFFVRSLAPPRTGKQREQELLLNFGNTAVHYVANILLDKGPKLSSTVFERSGRRDRAEPPVTRRGGLAPSLSAVGSFVAACMSIQFGHVTGVGLPSLGAVLMFWAAQVCRMRGCSKRHYWRCTAYLAIIKALNMLPLTPFEGNMLRNDVYDVSPIELYSHYLIAALKNRGCAPIAELAVPSTVQSDIDVCIMIDPLYDFLSENGVFCQTYGLKDTMNIRQVRKTLSELLQECVKIKDMHIILVTSDYLPSQFKTVNNLCTTVKGTSFVIDGADDLVSGNNGNVTVLRKTTNSILDCAAPVKSHLLRLVEGKNVMICGVTSTSCVNCAVYDLLPHCRSITVARDSIACKNSAQARETKVIEKWKSENKVDDTTADPPYCKIRIINKWNQVIGHQEP